MKYFTHIMGVHILNMDTYDTLHGFQLSSIFFFKLKKKYSQTILR